MQMQFVCARYAIINEAINLSGLLNKSKKSNRMTFNF